MAVALEDQKLIRTLANGNGGWKWYLDDYISDRYFYNEEFGKQYSMVGEMLLFARGLERLGLDDLGYGYTGKGGATVRKYLEGILRVGYPRTDLPGGLPRYGKVTMGDAKGGFPGGPRFLFQQAIVTGYLADGSGGNARWMQANMNGRDHRGAKVDKMLEPLWFEIAQAKWPNAGFGYFLAQMARAEGQQILSESLLRHRPDRPGASQAAGAVLRCPGAAVSPFCGRRRGQGTGSRLPRPSPCNSPLFMSTTCRTAFPCSVTRPTIGRSTSTARSPTVTQAARGTSRFVAIAASW